MGTTPGPATCIKERNSLQCKPYTFNKASSATCCPLCEGKEKERKKKRKKKKREKKRMSMKLQSEIGGLISVKIKLFKGLLSVRNVDDPAATPIKIVWCVA
eukprot:1140865-Pelagomonas_calceolata.AAC.4